MILSGQKKEEYREIKPYWVKRLVNREYDIIRFRNGYNPDSPAFDIEYNGVYRGLGNSEWGAPGYPVYILRLGNIINEN